MARRTAEELSNTSLSLVYIAGNLTDAQRAERLLTEIGIEYAVDLEPFTTTALMSGHYMGLFMYVPTLEHQRCRELLKAQGFTDTVPLEETCGESTDGA